MKTPKDILIWLRDVAKNNKIQQKLNYHSLSLWWFFESTLTYFIYDILQNRKHTSPTNSILKYLAFIPGYYYIYLILRILPRVTWGKLVEGDYKKRRDNHRRVMAISYSGYWKRVDIPQLKGKVADHDTMLGAITHSLRNCEFDLVSLDIDSSLFFDLPTMLEKRYTWKPVEKYLSFSAIKAAFKAVTYYNKERNKLIKSEAFTNSLDYNSTPLAASLKRELIKIFGGYAFEAVLYIEIMREAIRSEKPDLILITYEYGLLGRAAVFAGKLEGVPTLALQHGNLSQNHIGYIHSKEEISPKLTPEHCPLPDKTAVSGPWYKKILIEYGNYPTDSIEVTGQPRYDFLGQADMVFDRQAYCQKNGLRNQKTIVLICTQPMLSLHLRDIIIEFNKLPDIQIVIKPHPLEKKRQLEKLIWPNSKNVLVLPENSNTYESIYSCDLMLALFSTTITEALMLNKPVIIVNLTGQANPMTYVESKVALNVSKIEELGKTINDVLHGVSIGEELAKARNDFIYEHCYKMDGKATDRVIETISDLIAIAKLKQL